MFTKIDCSINGINNCSVKCIKRSGDNFWYILRILDDYFLVHRSDISSYIEKTDTTYKINCNADLLSAIEEMKSVYIYNFVCTSATRSNTIKFREKTANDLYIYVDIKYIKRPNNYCRMHRLTIHTAEIIIGDLTANGLTKGIHLIMPTDEFNKI